METEEIVNLLIFITVLTIVIFITIFLLKGKGGDILEAIKNIFRFGG